MKPNRSEFLPGSPNLSPAPRSLPLPAGHPGERCVDVVQTLRGPARTRAASSPAGFIPRMLAVRRSCILRPSASPAWAGHPAGRERRGLRAGVQSISTLIFMPCILSDRNRPGKPLAPASLPSDLEQGGYESALPSRRLVERHNSRRDLPAFDLEAARIDGRIDLRQPRPRVCNRRGRRDHHQAHLHRLSPPAGRTIRHVGKLSVASENPISVIPHSRLTGSRLSAVRGP